MKFKTILFVLFVIFVCTFLLGMWIQFAADLPVLAAQCGSVLAGLSVLAIVGVCVLALASSAYSGPKQSAHNDRVV